MDVVRHAIDPDQAGHRHLPLHLGLVQQGLALGQGAHVQADGQLAVAAGRSIEERQVVVAGGAGPFQVMDAEVRQSLVARRALVAVTLAGVHPRYPVVRQRVQQHRLDEAPVALQVEAGRVGDETLQRIQLLQLPVEALLDPADALVGDLGEALPQLVLLGVVHGSTKQDGEPQADTDHQYADEQEQTAVACRKGKGRD